ncbi:DUF6663 family protein [Halopenitus salinus]|uniref:DUF6663 family protein n=1 Tax=Halopenitus salinus TaxID=1198295 RepID=A0ABD5UTW6_9EURY
MQPTTVGRFRVQRREGDAFTLVEVPDEPVHPDDPDADEAYAPLRADGDHSADVEPLEPGWVVDATLAWSDATARIEEYTVVRETRIHVADEVTGMFEAAREAWRNARAAGDAMVSTTTRGRDGTPNGALYLFADPPGRDTLSALADGSLPLEPLVARVNERLDDGEPRSVFLLRPDSDDYVAVLVAFRRDGILARTVRDTYDLGSALADRLDDLEDDAGIYGELEENATSSDGADPSAH